MKWLLGMAMQYIIAFSIPYAYGMIMDWPVHFVSSAAAGFLGYSLILTTCRSLWHGFWGQAPPRQVVSFTRLLSSSVGISVALSLHYTLDYWPRAQPMMRLLER